MVGEAKFLRAYYYYDLVKRFGGVPLASEPLLADQFDLTRASASEVYELIESDLKSAAELLPTKSEYASSELGRATKGAALAMLVKVLASQASIGYLGQDFYSASKWAEAKTYAEQLFASTEYDLYTGDYRNIFTEAGENGIGSIFEVQFYASPAGAEDGAYTNNGNFTTFLGMPWFGAGEPYGRYSTTYDLFLAFEEGDPRREASVINILEYAKVWTPDILTDAVVGSRTGFANYKNTLSKERYDALGSGKVSPVNERIIRLSDIYLLYAEACFETGNTATATEYINRVRTRARGAGTIPADLATVTIDDIYKERRVELSNEGHRWHDLIRTGRLESVLKTKGYKIQAAIVDNGDGTYTYSDGTSEPLFKAENISMPKHLFFPLPQSEIDNTSGAIEQNPGY